uniref:DOMON domain-containing protein n=1 Tax=Brassica oleracea TaxID=3712 RepID=A0A3P6GVX4_BRAOL|nr:unnamed protein product [Brassica oleracea]
MSLSSRAVLVVMCFLFLSCTPLFTSATTTTVQGLQPRCESHIFNNGKHYRSCKDLPVLDSFLHFSYARETGVLDVAYRHANLESSSWIAWAINPTKKGMLGAQALVAYRNSTSGVMRAYTSNINSYATMLQESPLSFRVTQVSAEYLDGEMTIFATMVLPPNTTVVNHLWQDGPLKEGDRLGMHAMSGDHLKSIYGSTLHEDLRNIRSHMVLRTRRLSAHRILGRSSRRPWNSDLHGIAYRDEKHSAYRDRDFNILFRVLANTCAQSKTGVYNIYKGFVILQPGSGWKIAYTAIICAIGAFAIVMEILQFKKRWGSLFVKKSEDLQEANQSAFKKEILKFMNRWGDKTPEDLEANQYASTEVV